MSAVLNHSLKDLTLILHAVGYELRLLPHDQDNPFEQLVLELEEQIILQIYDPASVYVDANEYQALMGSQAELEQGLGGLVFYWQSDILLNRQRSLETYQLLAFLNQLLPLGYFDYHFDDSVIDFTYQLALESGLVQPELVAQILEKLNFFLPRLSSAIKSLHTTDVSLAETYEHALNQLKS